MEIQANNEDFSESSSTIVRIVSSVLEKLIISNDSTKSNLNYKHTKFAKFESSCIPDVSIEPYLERLRRYSRCSDACFVMSLVYVDKLIESKNLILTSLNVHRLLVTCVMIAAKFHDDFFYNNAYFSKLGGISLQELNLLEIDLLSLLSYSLFVNIKSYDKYSLQLKNYIFYLDVAILPYDHYSTDSRPLIPSPCKMPLPSIANLIPSSSISSSGVNTALYSFSHQQSSSNTVSSSVEHTLTLQAVASEGVVVRNAPPHYFANNSNRSAVNHIHHPLSFHTNPVISQSGCHSRGSSDRSNEWYGYHPKQSSVADDCANIYQSVEHQTIQDSDKCRFSPDSLKVLQHTRGVVVNDDPSVQPFNHYYYMQQQQQSIAMKESKELLLHTAASAVVAAQPISVVSKAAALAQYLHHSPDMNNEIQQLPLLNHDHSSSNSHNSDYFYHVSHQEEEQKKRNPSTPSLLYHGYHTQVQQHYQRCDKELASYHNKQMIQVPILSHSTASYGYHNNLSLTVTPPPPSYCANSSVTSHSLSLHPKYSNYHNNGFNSNNNHTNVNSNNTSTINNNRRVSYPTTATIPYDYTSSAASIQKGSIAAKYASHLMMFGSPISLNSCL